MSTVSTSWRKIPLATGEQIAATYAKAKFRVLLGWANACFHRGFRFLVAALIEMSNEPFQNGYEQNVSSVFQKSVIELFERHLKAGSAYAPAAASVLTEVIKSSEEETIMGLEVQLKQAADAILKTAPMTAFVSLKASTELFLRFVIRTSLEFSDFEECKRRLIERGEYFKGRTEASRDKIAQVGERFIQDGSVILTHGNSRVVAAVFERAAKTKRFRVYVTESRPDGSGYSFAERLLSAGVSVTIILDSSVGERVCLFS